MEYRFREFINFTAKFSIAAGHFLKQEWYCCLISHQTRDLIKDWQTTLSLLHEQFRWPMPTFMPLPDNRRKSVNSSSIANDDRQVTRRTSHSSALAPSASRTSITATLPPSNHKKVKSRREIELRELLAASIEGDFPELNLLVASMLLDFNHCILILQHYENLIANWTATLLGTKNAHYSKFVDLVTEQLKQ